MRQAFNDTPFLLEMDSNNSIKAHNINSCMSFLLNFSIDEGRIKFPGENPRKIQLSDIGTLREIIKDRRLHGQPLHCMMCGEVDTVKADIRVTEIRIS